MASNTVRDTSPALQRYGAALGAVAGAFLFTWLLRPAADQMPFALFAPALVASAWYGGMGPGIAAALASTAVGAFVLLAGAPEAAGLWLVVSLVTTVGVAAAKTRISGRDLIAARRAAREYRTFVSLVESSPDFIGLATLEGTPLFINEAGRKLVGLSTLDEARRTPVLEFYPPEEQRRIDEEVLPRVRRGERWAGETHFRHFGTGASIPVHQDLFSVTDARTGRPIALATVSRDLTERKRAEIELRAAAERLQFVAEAVPEKIFRATPAGDVEYFNRLWLEFTGLSVDQMRKWGWTQFVHPDDLEENLRRWKHSLETGEPFEFEVRFRRADGVYRWHLSRARAMRDARGDILMWFGTNTDIDDLKRAQRELGESEARLQEEVRVVETLNRVGASVASTLDRETIVQEVTDAATQLTGARFGAFFYNVLDEAGGSYMLYALSGAPREAFANFPHPRNTAIFAPTFSGRSVVRLDDVTRDPRYGKSPPYNGMPPGHLPVHSYLAVPVKTAAGEVLGGLFFGHENTGVFTERHERLAVGVAGWAALALENAGLYRAAQESNRLKDEFLATLSHELRTPLNAILGWSHLLRSGLPDGGRAAESIERNARAQAQLIDDLLDVSRVVSGTLQIQPEPADLAVVISGAVDAVRPAALAKRIDLGVELDESARAVLGEPRRLQQIVWNLLSNAVKFTPEAGRVEVVLARADRHAEITVRDTGPGIPEQFFPHLFNRFRQADATITRRHGGLGLGLAIVKHLTEAHGGSVSVASREGEGTTFTVRLPLDADRGRPGSEGLRPAEPVRPDLGGLHVLVVDDEPDARDLLAVGLSRCGAHVTAVGSAGEALQAWERARFDVLVADVGMPEMNGHDLIRTIRAGERERGGHRMQAVAVTAYASLGERDAAVSAGFDWHVGKPVDSDAVAAVVAEMAGRG